MSDRQYSVSMDIPAFPATTASIMLVSNIVLYSGDSLSAVNLIRKDSILWIQLLRGDYSTVIQEAPTSISPLLPHHIRIIFHDLFISVYADGLWLATFEPVIQSLPSTLSLYLRFTVFTGATSVTNIVKQELSYWREAVWIDMESTGANALSSVIQERPVEITPCSNGSLAFSYNRSRDAITLAHVISHTPRKVTSPSACSDAILYAYETGISVDTEYAEDYGFLTRILRLPNLESDALAAAAMAQTKARGRLIQHNVTLRASPIIEPGDIAHLSYTLKGATRALSWSMIVEQLTMSFSTGIAKMTLVGRNNE